MARTFNGSTDVLTFNGGGTTGFGGAITYAAVIRRTGTTNSGIVGRETSGNVTRDEFYLNQNPSGSPPSDTLRYYNGASSSVGTTTMTVASGSGWTFVAVTKATGTQTPRFHKYVYSTDTWSHENGGSTYADCTSPGAGGKVTIGETDGDKFTGDIAWVGCWNAALSDAQIESLAFNLVAVLSSSPAALWILDQDAVGTSVEDMVGDATQSARSGTTVATTSVPVWNYGDGPWQMIRPQAAAAGGGTVARRLPLLGVG